MVSAVNKEKDSFAEEIIATYDFNDDRTSAFTIYKKKRQQDSIGWVIGTLLLFFFTFISAGRISVIGMFFDDVIFNLFFGWIKFPIYITLLLSDLVLYLGVKFKFKFKFLAMLFISSITLCWLISLILITINVVNDINLDEGIKFPFFWSKDIFKQTWELYWSKWLSSSIFSPQFASTDKIEFLFSSRGYFILDAGGGLLGNLFASVSCYLSILGAYFVWIIWAFFNANWVLTGDLFYLFRKKDKRRGRSLRLLSMKKQNNPNSQRSKFNSQKPKLISVYKPPLAIPKENNGKEQIHLAVKPDSKLITSSDMNLETNIVKKTEYTQKNCLTNGVQSKTVDQHLTFDNFDNFAKNFDNFIEKQQKSTINNQNSKFQPPKWMNPLDDRPILFKSRRERNISQIDDSSKFKNNFIDMYKLKMMPHSQELTMPISSITNPIPQEKNEMEQARKELEKATTVTPFGPKTLNHIGDHYKLPSLNLLFDNENEPLLSNFNFKDVIKSINATKPTKKLAFVLGKNDKGAITANLSVMPTILLGGSYNGHIALIHTMIASILLRAKPSEVKFLLIDFVKNQLVIYEKIPHLMAPLVSETNEAIHILEQLEKEIQIRNSFFRQSNTDNIEEFNKVNTKQLPYIVVVISELSELILNNINKQFYKIINDLTKFGKSVGISLVTATKNLIPSVITPEIKANFATRLTFLTNSANESKLILNCSGAELLTNKKTMIFADSESNKIINLQQVEGIFVNIKELENIINWVKKQSKLDLFIQNTNTTTYK